MGKGEEGGGTQRLRCRKTTRAVASNPKAIATLVAPRTIIQTEDPPQDARPLGVEKSEGITARVATLTTRENASWPIAMSHSVSKVGSAREVLPREARATKRAPAPEVRDTIATKAAQKKAFTNLR
jgi:hypothetical protein